MDDSGNICPCGVFGELYIITPYLTLGYYNQPELTKEVFQKKLLSENNSILMYKTGDLARVLNDGNYQLGGRKDNQVKIRGIRVELEEIENQIRNHNLIKSAVVLFREDKSNKKHLVAYIVFTQKTSVKVTDLRHFLQQHLPEYMVPAIFVVLDALPLTPNGKVDRKALPAPDGNLSYQQEVLILPRNTVEFQLAQIWADILDINPIGVTNSFFELGGNSLLAVVLMSKINQIFQRDLPLAVLFRNPTIEQLATLLPSNEDSLPWSSLVSIQKNGDQPPLFCIHPAGGNVLCYQYLSYFLGSEQPFYGIQPVGTNPQNEPHTSIEQMATHYIQELKTVQPHGPYFLLGWSLGGIIAFDMACQLVNQDEQVAFLGLIDSRPCTSTEQELEPESDSALLINLIEKGLNLNHYLGLCLEEFRQLAPDEQLIQITKQAKQKKLIPEDFDFDLDQARCLLITYKLNCQAWRNYSPRYYSNPISLFKATERDKALKNDVTYDWNQLAEKVETYPVPGTHLSMVEPPHVETLARQIQKSLDEVQKHYSKKSDN